jgi:hypothetical protein
MTKKKKPVEKVVGNRAQELINDPVFAEFTSRLIAKMTHMFETLHKAEDRLMGPAVLFEFISKEAQANKDLTLDQLIAMTMMLAREHERLLKEVSHQHMLSLLRNDLLKGLGLIPVEDADECDCAHCKARRGSSPTNTPN